jgi:hypothetical protein
MLTASQVLAATALAVEITVDSDLHDALVPCSARRPSSTSSNLMVRGTVRYNGPQHWYSSVLTLLYRTVPYFASTVN